MIESEKQHCEKVREIERDYQTLRSSDITGGGGGGGGKGGSVSEG